MTKDLKIAMVKNLKGGVIMMKMTRKCGYLFDMQSFKIITGIITKNIIMVGHIGFSGILYHFWNTYLVTYIHTL